MNAPNPKKAFGDKKPPLGQLPLVAQIHAALAFYDGKGKYGNRNWRKSHVEATTYIEAILRHVRLWENGEEFARDTGVHNLGGVIASASLLLDAQANGVLIDDRVTSPAACDLLHAAEADITRLNEQHAARRATMAEAEAPEEGEEDEYVRQFPEDSWPYVERAYDDGFQDGHEEAEVKRILRIPEFKGCKNRADIEKRKEEMMAEDASLNGSDGGYFHILVDEGNGP